MKVYTRTGDRGTTSLVGGTRVSKDSARLEAYGTVDELNSWLGLVQATGADLLDECQASVFRMLQNRLFDLGCLLATEPESAWQPADIAPQDIEAVEHAIDAMEADLPLHNQFVLPGGSIASAQAQVARTVARRAERRMVSLSTQVAVSPGAMRLINRISDWLFVLARWLNHRSNTPELFWASPKP